MQKLCSPKKNRELRIIYVLIKEVSEEFIISLTGTSKPKRGRPKGSTAKKQKYAVYPPGAELQNNSDSEITPIPVTDRSAKPKKGRPTAKVKEPFITPADNFDTHKSS
ncbi:MAG: hypothetical protein LBP22_14385 [Deltaproteobacteria bacterium]|jgi:hypothetical protein|nr:hypothetical protein [Deltaproteobacteria bacterium]